MVLTGDALTPVLQTVVFLPRDHRNLQLISLVIPMTIVAFLTNAINLAYLFIADSDCNHHYAGAVFYQASYWLMDLLLMTNAWKLLKQTNNRYRHVINLVVFGLFLAAVVAGITEIVQKPMMVVAQLGNICIPGFATTPWTVYGACELSITLILALFFIEELAMTVRAMRKEGESQYTILEAATALSKDHIVLSLLAAFILFVTHTLIEHNTLGANTFSLIFISQPMTVRLITYSVNPEFAPVHDVSRSVESLTDRQKQTADKLGYSNGRLSRGVGAASAKSLHAERMEFRGTLERSGHHGGEGNQSKPKLTGDPGQPTQKSGEIVDEEVV